jgi:hypothetical protein
MKNENETDTNQTRLRTHDTARADVVTSAFAFGLLV